MKNLRLALPGALVLAATLLYVLLADRSGDGPRSGTQTPPWTVVTTADGGSRVFGIELGRSTLAEARRQFGNDVAIALIVSPDGSRTLEAHSERIEAGFITGALTLRAELAGVLLQDMQHRAVRSAPLASGARRLSLAPEDLAVALAAPVAAIAFVPSLQLDAAMVGERFGPAAETLPGHDGTTHLLYPAIGLDVAINTQARELFQYVRPDAFARLRAPLVASAATDPAEAAR
jgi:hypothetical protein